MSVIGLDCRGNASHALATSTNKGRTATNPSGTAAGKPKRVGTADKGRIGTNPSGTTAAGKPKRVGTADKYRTATNPSGRCRVVCLTLLITAVLVLILLMLSQPGAAIAHEGEDDPMPADTGDGLRPVYEVPSGADRIIGSPDPGPEPQQSGDRGGSLQLATMGAVAAAVALIAWRISHAARRSRHHRVAQTSS